MTPFILALVAVAWDLYEFTSHRSALAREVYAVAEAISNAPSTPVPAEPDDPNLPPEEPEEPEEVVLPPPEAAMARLRELLARHGVGGRIEVAVVVRAATRHDDEDCPHDEWCPPMVASVLFDVWGAADSPCGEPTRLPEAGERFGADVPLLPAEHGTGEPESEWRSRNMRVQGWWVVVDACLEPHPGRFARVLSGLSLRLLDPSSVAIRSRTTWPSFYDLAECTWCGAPG